MKYIAFYDSLIFEKENRRYSLSSKQVIDYITSTIAKNGKNIEIVSPSWTDNNSGYYKSRKLKVFDNVLLTVCPSFGTRNKLFMSFRRIFTWFWLLTYLLKNTRKDEEVIVYHSPKLIMPILIAKLIIRFNLTLQVGEVYQDVYYMSFLKRKLENIIFKSANKFILSTELLNKKINGTNRPYIVLHGTYNVESDRAVSFEDYKIHVVYAGKINSTKGARISVDIAKYLPMDKYRVHIIGFGTEDDINKLKNRINELNINQKSCEISYDGLLSGEQFLNFIQKCDIGLCTQDITASYNESSFPSKILTYMANGLLVVSSKITAIENSILGKYLYFYEEESPEIVAEIIKKIDAKSIDSRKVIQELNDEFELNIIKFLSRS